jgi:small subunit ribosomal protein S18
MAATFTRSNANRSEFTKKDTRGRDYVDYKDAEALRRLMTPNGKIYSRKRLGVSARDQRLIAQAIKRARYMALLPYTSATL